MIKSVLVANRGEIARRVFRTCRRMGVRTVAVHSDADAGAPFVAEADEAFALGGAAPADSYLRGDAIVAAALACDVDAVHPGYGFLAENAGLAAGVIDAGLVWIGPSPEAISAMGSKTEARSRMAAANVPVLPEGAESFPVIVKASAGGGGKGMRLVERVEDLDAAVEAAKREAASAFGDDTVFIERYLASARHVEIQIFGDTHGRVVALHERDCSVQRRHQKVIEEAPSPAVDEELRAAMAAAAVAAGVAIGYVGAGTVEFLLDGRDFYFLEVNTRLQVEHPVTELVTGLDLVELQLRVAEGRPLPEVPPLSGHAVEARLYAENPAAGFLPVTGTLDRFIVGDGVRVDSGVESGSVIGPHYDPMLAKVIAHAPTREEAVRRLSDALARAEIHGLATNRDFLVRVLRHPEFLGGTADTGFLDRVEVAELAAPLLDEGERRAACAAAALARQWARRAAAPVLGSLPSGWRNVPSELQVERFDGVEVAYRFDRGVLAELLVDWAALGESVSVRCAAGRVDLTVDGRTRRYSVHLDGDAVHVNVDTGQLSLVCLPRNPRPEAAAAAGSLTAPMPGAVIRVLAAEGDVVGAGQPLLVVEAMKMEHEIVSPHAGRVVELRVGEGAQVEAGAALAVIEAE